MASLRDFLSSRAKERRASTWKGSETATGSFGPHNLVLPAAFAFLHRSFAAAAIFALTAGDIFLFCFRSRARAGLVPLMDAHLAFAAAEIAARPAALIRRF